MTYVAKVFGWMTVIEASNKQEALGIAKALAPGASLLQSDVNITHISRASEDDVVWHQSMSRAPLA